ncbi:hypothetical protein KCP74_06585 [Salmonella enterica subsp. enterica]|nr:hypothetical protein KCP74_06585 [Salmonella enterica subsp. enterica]
MFDVQIMAQNRVNGADSFPAGYSLFVLAGEIMNAWAACQSELSTCR